MAACIVCVCVCVRAVTMALHVNSASLWRENKKKKKLKIFHGCFYHFTMAKDSVVTYSIQSVKESEVSGLSGIAKSKFYFLWEFLGIAVH